MKFERKDIEIYKRGHAKGFSSRSGAVKSSLMKRGLSGNASKIRNELRNRHGSFQTLRQA